MRGLWSVRRLDGEQPIFFFQSFDHTLFRLAIHSDLLRLPAAWVGMSAHKHRFECLVCNSIEINCVAMTWIEDDDGGRNNTANLKLGIILCSHRSPTPIANGNTFWIGFHSPAANRG